MPSLTCRKYWEREAERERKRETERVVVPCTSNQTWYTPSSEISRALPVEIIGIERGRERERERERERDCSIFIRSNIVYTIL